MTHTRTALSLLPIPALLAIAAPPTQADELADPAAVCSQRPMTLSPPHTTGITPTAKDDMAALRARFLGKQATTIKELCL